MTQNQADESAVSLESRARHRRTRAKRQHKSFLVLGALGLVLAALMVTSGGAIASPSTLFVAPGGSLSNTDTSCSDAGFSSIQSAVNAAIPGDTVQVCAGTYEEQVNVGVSGITINGAGAAATIVDPTTPTLTARDLDSGASIVPIFEVNGQSNVTISNLKVEGSGLSNTFSGCGTNFVGILFQGASGAVSSATVDTVELPPGLFGCQDGLAIFTQAPSGPQHFLAVTRSMLTAYDKAGVVCVDAHTTCSITYNTITGAGPSSTAQNGVQVGPGAPGSVVSHNLISANDYAGPTNPTEPQADFAAGILLYGATGTVAVNHNSLSDNQIGVEAVATNATINHNSLSQASPGINGSIGIFAVACDYYCGYLGLTGNSNVTDNIVHNQISFPGSSTIGTYGIWTNDSAANGGSGVVLAHLVKNAIDGAATLTQNG